MSSDLRLMISSDWDAKFKDALITIPSTASFLELKRKIAAAIDLNVVLGTLPRAESLLKSIVASAGKAPIGPPAASGGFAILVVQFGNVQAVSDISGTSDDAIIGSTAAAAAAVAADSKSPPGGPATATATATAAPASAATAAAPLGIADRSTLVLVTPASIKPKVIRRNAPARDREDAAGGKSDGKRDPNERHINDYKGWKVRTCLAQWLAAEKASKKQTLGLEFIEMNASEVLAQDEFTQLKVESVTQILKSNKLNVESEAEVFNAAVAWAEAEIARVASTASAAASTSTDTKTAAVSLDVKSVLVKNGLMNLIRFPVMSIQDIIKHVTPKNLLEADQLVQLYTYIGSSAAVKSGGDSDSKSVPVPEALKVFSRTPRAGVRLGTQRIDAESKVGPGILINKDGTEISVNQSSCWTSCYGKFRMEELSKTEVYWEVEVVSMGSYCAIGIAGPNAANNSGTSYGADSYSWVWYAQTGQAAHAQSPLQYSNVWGRGTRIGVLANLKTQQLSFYRDGAEVGPIPYTIPNIAECRPLFSLYAPGDLLKINWNARKPAGDAPTAAFKGTPTAVRGKAKSARIARK